RVPAPTRPPIWMVVLVLGGIAAYLMARVQVLPSLAGGDIPAADNPLVDYGIGARFLTAGKVYFHYLRLLVAPVALSADYSANAITVAESLGDPDAFAGLVLMALSIGALVFTSVRRPAVAACLALFAVLYSLLSHLVILNTILLAERLLYLPSLAFAALVGVVAMGAVRAVHRPIAQRVLLAFGLLVIALYAGRSMHRVGDWRDPVSLFRSSLAAFPDSARARYNLGRQLSLRNDLEGAEAELVEATLILPGDAQALTTLANVRFRMGRYATSLQSAEAAFAARPSGRRAALVCRGRVAAGKHQAALELCGTAAADRPGDAEVRFFWATALLETGDKAAAAAVVREATEIEPNNPAILSLQRRLYGQKLDPPHRSP
ncbi:MAG: tetratricopeptide (TPR) repeat protein, partial [Myxococcota bacterium]